MSSRIPNRTRKIIIRVIALVLAIIFCACALLLFLRHVNKEEEIHITQ